MDFKEILIQKYHFTEKDWDYTLQFFIPETVEANTHFLKSGKISDKIGLVNVGILRSYQEDSDNQIITTHFYLPGSVAISIDSFNNRVPSVESIIALEKSELFTISYHRLHELYTLVPAWQQVCKDVAEIKNKDLLARTLQFQTLTASQRYQSFCQQYPEVAKKVALKHISSYLGIDNATLSRIRRNI